MVRMSSLDDLPSKSGEDGAFSDFYNHHPSKVDVLLCEGCTSPQMRIVTDNTHFLIRSLRRKSVLSDQGQKRGQKRQLEASGGPDVKEKTAKKAASGSATMKSGRCFKLAVNIARRHGFRPRSNEEMSGDDMHAILSSVKKWTSDEVSYFCSKLGIDGNGLRSAIVTRIGDHLRRSMEPARQTSAELARNRSDSC